MGCRYHSDFFEGKDRMKNPSLNISLLCLAPKYLDLILWALFFGLHWRVDVHERASNHHGFRSFVRAFGLHLSSCHRVIVGLVVSCSKIGQKPAKTKFLQNICANAKTTNNWAEVRMVSDSDIKFMALSKLNRG